MRDASVAPRRLTTTDLGLCAASALAVAAAGVGGVLAFAVGQQAAEFAVRLALGATPAQVRRGVLCQALALAGAGLAAGLAFAGAGGCLTSGLLFAVTTYDGPTYAPVTLVLFGVALLASYLPARRAARVAPAATLRRE